MGESAPVRSRQTQELRVPSLFRLLLVLGLLAAIVYGAMIGMVTYLKPQPHAVTQTITLPPPPPPPPPK